MNDFETVREEVGWHGKAGAALSRIEAKVEALAKTDFVAEVERLRGEQQVSVELSMEVERLEAEVERLRRLVAGEGMWREDDGGWRSEALFRRKEVERLRAALERMSWETDIRIANAFARNALAEEKVP